MQPTRNTIPLMGPRWCNFTMIRHVQNCLLEPHSIFNMQVPINGLPADPTPYPYNLTFPTYSRRKIVDASLGGSHTIALTSQGQLLSWGRNSLGRLGRVVNGPHSGIPGEVKFPPLPNERKWICVKLSCGGRHNMALCVETKTKEERERALRAYFNNDNNIR